MITLTQRNSEKTINLENVSVIAIETSKQKVIFNFMNSINKFGRKTPDYAYLTYETEEDAYNAYNNILEIEFISNEFFISSFNDSIVNKHSINTISIREDKKLIIFNLNFPVSGDNKSSISKSVFWSYNTDLDFMEDKKLILDSIDEKHYID